MDDVLEHTSIAPTPHCHLTAREQQQAHDYWAICDIDGWRISAGGASPDAARAQLACAVAAHRAWRRDPHTLPLPVSSMRYED